MVYILTKGNVFFVVSSGRNKIDVFDRNVTFKYSIPTGSYPPYGVNGFKNELFVSTSDGNVLVLQGKIITKVYNNLCTGYITSLLIDNNGFMVVPCFSGTVSYLYHTNGTYMNKSMPIAVNTFGIRIDSKGRLITTSRSELDIFHFRNKNRFKRTFDYNFSI